MPKQEREKITVLFVCIDHTLGGSTLSLYNLIESVRSRIDPIVLFPKAGVGYEFFIDHGIECLVQPFVKLYSFRTNNLIDVWHHPWRWHRIIKIRIDLGCALNVKKKLKRRKVDIVHTNTSPNNVGVYLSCLLKAKHVWQVRECLDAHAKYSIYGGMPRLIRQINHADARIAISTYVKDHWRMVNNNTFLVYDAVCHKDDSVYLFPKDKYVLFVSYNVTETKGGRKAVRAFGESRLNEDGYRLVLLGNCNDEYRASLIDTGKEYHCENAIVFAPCQHDVKPFFERASAFIMASENEGLGRVTVEAMFYGCPVIAHASGGTLDIVKDGETGYLFKTVEECATLLRRVCFSKTESMVLRAQKFVVDNLSQDVFGPKVLEVYNAVLKDR